MNEFNKSELSLNLSFRILEIRKPDCPRIANVIYTICDVTHSQHPIFDNRHIVNKNFYKTNLNRFESTTINEMKPPKRQRKQSAKSQMTQGTGPKRQKTSNRQQRQETDSYNVPPELLPTYKHTMMVTIVRMTRA